MAEVVPGAGQQRRDDFLQRLFGAGLQLGRRGGMLDRHFEVARRRQFDALGVVPQIDQFLRHLDHGHDEVDRTGTDRRHRHAFVFRVVRRLHDGDAALFLDPRQTHGAVGAGAGQHDRDRALAVHLGQGAEEQVDRHVLAARTLQLLDDQEAIHHRQVHVGRDHVDVAGFDLDPRGHLHHRHAGGALEDRCGRARMLGRQVQDDDEGHLVGRRHVLEQALQGGQAAGRCANSDHREMEVAGDDARLGGQGTGDDGGIGHLEAQ